MGRAAPYRAPLPRGKGAGRSPKAGDGRGRARAYAGRGKQKAPRPPGQRGAQTRGKTPLPSGLYRRHRNSTGSAAADGPQLAGFHRRWGLAPRPEAAPLYHAAPPGATLFCHARAADGRGGTGTAPARRMAGRTCGERGAGPGQPGARTGPARRSAARALRFFPAAAGGGLLPQAAVSARLSTRCAGRSWCAGSRAPCGCRAFRGTSRRAP